MGGLYVSMRDWYFHISIYAASIHMPRISSHPRPDRKEWYAVERLLRKHAGLNSVDIYVWVGVI